jgi:tetratricopeptide (TPR) repeat protein
VTPYLRQDVIRMLRLKPRQLSAWERAGLVPIKDEYGFSDLGHLLKLRDLRAKRISAANIQASVTAMRAVSGVSDPLLEASAVVNGSRVAFRHFGAVVEPIARQFVLDFDGSLGGKLAEVGDTASRHAARLAARDGHVAAMFMEAVQLEEAARFEEAAGLYEQVLSIDPEHAPSCINLGTICYNQRKFTRAEQLYRRATLADPGYALAYFDLGNVLDELQRLPEAIEAYRLAPRYADAHYNLALAYERSTERRRALKHWATYLKLDASGPWAKHAREQVRKTLEREKLKIVHRAGRKAGAVSTPVR